MQQYFSGGGNILHGLTKNSAELIAETIPGISTTFSQIKHCNKPNFNDAMESGLLFEIMLLQPPPLVVFGLQKGSGAIYETVQKQLSDGHDLSFSFMVIAKGDRLKDTIPKLSGPFVQGPANGRFIYIDIGTYAGEAAAVWSRRLKVPLTGIGWKTIDALLAQPEWRLQTRVPGTGKDGSPNCAMVKPFNGWQIKK